MESYIDPTRESFDAFKALPRDTPINMLNLIKLREKAAYPKGHPHADKGWSGAEAYAEYGRSSAATFDRVGGRIVWRGALESIVTGPQDEVWDLAFIAAYPDAAAFLAMVTDAEYKLAVVNRQAAVLTSRLVRFQPLPIEGNSFA